MEKRIDAEGLIRLMERTLESLAQDLGADAPFVRGFIFATEVLKMEAGKSVTGAAS
jgi:4-diphosphocytidyl-2C-methyl-D-erythritol kinase